MGKRYMSILKNPPRHWWVHLLLWGFLALLTFLCFALRFPEAVERIEMSLLDMRLQARAKTLTPSKDILFVAMDRRTQDYTRNHPEMGITGTILPRSKVASMVNFLTEHGAKAIILDVTFEAPQSAAEDEALAAAIQKSGKVYIAASAELPLSSYIARRQSDETGRQLDFNTAFVNGIMLPHLEKQAAFYQWLSGGSCLPGYTMQGFGPVFDSSQFFSLPETVFKQAWASSCENQTRLPLTGFQGIAANSSSAKIDFLHSFYERQCLEQMYEETFRTNPGFLKLLAQQQSRQLRAGTGPAYCMVSPIQEDFIQHARGVGITTVDYDRDTMIRQVPLLYRLYQGNLYGYLGLQAALDLVESSSFQADANTLWLNQRNIPLQENQQLLINWRNPDNLISQIYAERGLRPASQQDNSGSTEAGSRDLGYGHLYRKISVIDLLRKAEQTDQGPLSSLYHLYDRPETGEIDFHDKIVIYGDALQDVHRTPMGSIIYGPEIVATVLDSILHDDKFIRKASGALVGILVALLCGTLIWSQVSFSRMSTAIGFGLGLIVLYWFFNFVLFIVEAYWVPLVLPTLALSVTLLAGIVYRYYVHDREKRQLTSVFSRYVSPQVMDQILANPDESLKNLSGVEKNLTVLFADLQGFTERFTQENPEQMVKQLNEFFTVMTHIILKHQGTYDKYIGDAVMAFFGAPAEFDDHASKACAAALDMQEELEKLNERWRAQGIQELKLGIGLSTGEMIVGNFGSDVLQNFTVMGNAVNLGARLEALTRKVDCPIVISEETRRQAANRIEALDLGLHTIKGYTEPVQAFGLIRSKSRPKM